MRSWHECAARRAHSAGISSQLHSCSLRMPGIDVGHATELAAQEEGIAGRRTGSATVHARKSDDYQCFVKCLHRCCCCSTPANHVHGRSHEMWWERPPTISQLQLPREVLVVPRARAGSSEHRWFTCTPASLACVRFHAAGSAAAICHCHDALQLFRIAHSMCVHFSAIQSQLQ